MVTGRINLDETLCEFPQCFKDNSTVALPIKYNSYLFASLGLVLRKVLSAWYKEGPS